MILPEIVPLFPLPNFVLLPHVPSPFRAFEARYVALVRALVERDESDRWVAMPCLKGNWREDYEESPGFHSVAAVGLATQIRRRVGGEFLFVVEGRSRARLEEIPSPGPYRLARVTAAPDTDSDPMPDPTPLIQLASQAARVSGAMAGLTDGDPTPETLLFRLATAVLRDPAQKQRFLELSSPASRHRVLRDILLSMLGSARRLNGGPPHTM